MLSIRCSSDVTSKWWTKLVFSTRFSSGLQLLPFIDTGMDYSDQCTISSMTLVESSAMGQSKVFPPFPGFNIKNISGGGKKKKNNKTPNPPLKKQNKIKTATTMKHKKNPNQPKKQGLEPFCSSRTSFLLNEYVY